MNSLKHFKICIILIMVALTSSLAKAQISNDITHNDALKALLTAKQKAEELNVLVNIAVVDAGTNLKTFIRMDESFLGSIDIAIKKAKTSRYFNMATGDLGKLSQPGGIIYNIEHSNGGLITFPGGIPIVDQNKNIIGAIGVSGGTIEEDHDIALAGANAILNHLKN